MGDITADHAGSISSSGYSLTLSAYTVGARYRQHIGHSPLQPFGQVLVGLAHSSGSLVGGQSPAASNAGAAFAGSVTATRFNGSGAGLASLPATVTLPAGQNAVGFTATLLDDHLIEAGFLRRNQDTNRWSPPSRRAGKLAVE